MRKSNYALGLQIYKTNTIFLYSKMNYLIAKFCSEKECVNKPLLVLHRRHFDLHISKVVINKATYKVLMITIARVIKAIFE